MNTKPSQPAASVGQSQQDKPKDRYMPGDPIPVPDAVEANTESAWALFSDVPRQPEPDFLDTVPAPFLNEQSDATVRRLTE